MNAFLRTERARTIWIHVWAVQGGSGRPCDVDDCADPGLRVGIGFGPGTAHDPTAFTLWAVSLCQAHAERAAAESCHVRHRSRLVVLARHLLRIERLSRVNPWSLLLPERRRPA